MNKKYTQKTIQSFFTGDCRQVCSCFLVKVGLGIAGRLIIVFSTVTTTFLDAYSAGVSSESISNKIKGKWVAVGVTFLGVLGAVFLPLTDITEFLYFIGSVFAPMIAIQIVDFFVIKRDKENMSFNIKNLVVWIIGFIIYRLLMRLDIVVGNTLPDMLITMGISVLINRKKTVKKQS